MSLIFDARKDFSEAVTIAEQVSLLAENPAPVEAGLRRIQGWPPQIHFSSRAREDLQVRIGSLVSDFRQECSSLPTSYVPIHTLNQAEQLIYRVKEMKLLSGVLESLSEKTGEKGEKEVSRLMKGLIRNFCDIVSDELMSSPACFQDKKWLEEIQSIQDIFFKYLENPNFCEGDSKGILYKIQREGKTYGYLFGTLHYRPTEMTGEIHEALCFPSSIYKKLCKCVLLGTEIKFSSDRLSSFAPSADARLCSVAKQRGIVNFGIDTPERDKLRSQSEYSSSTEETVGIQKEYESRFLNSYRKGDREGLQDLFENPPKEVELPLATPEDVALAEFRDKVMAQNIDALLTAATQIHTGEAQPKSFFAVGSAHLLFHGGIPKYLTQMGWDVVAVD